MAYAITGELLDALVLSALYNKDTYGYELIKLLKDNLEISESTLYPVLRRLKKNELLETYDESINGRNRRYYKITVEGKIKCIAYKDQWIKYKNNIDNIFENERRGLND